MNAWPAKSGQRRERREKPEPLIGIAEGPLVSGASESILAAAKISCHKMLFGKSAIIRAAAGGRLPTTGEKVPSAVAVPVTNSDLRNPSRGDGEGLDATVGQLFYFRLASCLISQMPSEPGPTTTRYPGLKCAAKSRLLGVLEICLVVPVELVHNRDHEDDAVGIRVWRALLTNDVTSRRNVLFDRCQELHRGVPGVDIELAIKENS